MAQRGRKTGTPHTGGRVKGTPNKATAKVRERLTLFIEANWQGLESDFAVLKPIDRVIMYEKLLQYVTPKMQAVSLTEQVNAETQVILDILDKMPDNAVNEIVSRIIQLQKQQR